MDTLIASHTNSDEAAPKQHLTPARPLRAWHYCLLAIPAVGLLCPPFYSSWQPEMFGIPFFYVYQFLWIFVSAGLTAIVYRSVNR